MNSPTSFEGRLRAILPVNDDGQRVVWINFGKRRVAYTFDCVFARGVRVACRLVKVGTPTRVVVRHVDKIYLSETGERTVDGLLVEHGMRSIFAPEEARLFREGRAIRRPTLKLWLPPIYPADASEGST